MKVSSPWWWPHNPFIVISQIVEQPGRGAGAPDREPHRQRIPYLSARGHFLRLPSANPLVATPTLSSVCGASLMFWWQKRISYNCLMREVIRMIGREAHWDRIRTKETLIHNCHWKKFTPFFLPKAGVSKSRYIGISIPIKYSNFSRFYKKLGPFYKKYHRRWR